MKARSGHTLLLVGAWLSLLAFIVGGSILLPLQKNSAGDSTALLYKFARNEPVLNTPQVAHIGKSLIADLGSMHVLLYQDGVLMHSFVILSKGRPGAPWETPSGTYVIQAKEVKHYSSIGGTWMPYSMQFYGNFFIHGWPTYTSGESVPLGYSGGCIRLSTADAKVVYDFIPSGTKIVVISDDKQEVFATSSRYYLHGDGTPPHVSATSFIVGDIDSGAVLWERGSHELKNPKGLTLLVSALTALETVNQYKLVRMSELLLGSAILRKYSIGAVDEMPAGALIYPLLFDGSDTAAKVFSLEHGTKQFVKYMNEKSVAIGMSDTVFGGPLSTDESTTTARDLMMLLGYIKEHKHFLIDVSLAKDKTLTNKWGDRRYDWTNKNAWILSGDGTYRGGMAAVDSRGGGDAVLLFDIPLAEFSPRTIAITILDSENLVADVRTIRQFVLEHFVYGIERADGEFFREKEDPTPNLIQRAKELINLD
ncbi:MAG: hypothetical protein UY04_C0005G0001, partial [Parcubacteria group bacterium GW2011_GWA2_47_7]